MRNVNFRFGSSILAAGLIGGLLSAAQITSAIAGVPSLPQNNAVSLPAQVDQVHWRWGCCHYHHHYYHANPYFTQLVNAGVVSYPVYRIDHYKIDYTSPTYTYTAAPGWWGW